MGWVAGKPAVFARQRPADALCNARDGLGSGAQALRLVEGEAGTQFLGAATPSAFFVFHPRRILGEGRQLVL